MSVEDDARPRIGGDFWNLSWILLVIVIVVVGATALALYLYAGINDVPSLALLRTEAIKQLMQLVVIGIVGGYIAWMLTERSKRKDRALADAQQQAAQKRTDTEKEAEQRRAN